MEHAGIGLTVFARPDGDAAWTAISLTAGDTLPLPEIGIEIPVAELYEDVDLADASPQDTAIAPGGSTAAAT